MSTGKASLAGWIDSRRRPLINLRFFRERTVCASVDTGFNGYLLWEGTPENLTEFPGELSPLYESIEVAGGRILANLAWTSIQWFDPDGVYSEVEMLVALSDKHHQPGDPVAYVGTALLSGTILIVDFLNETVRIEKA